MPLTMALGKYLKVIDLDYIIATYQDPDIIASLDKWLLDNEKAKVVISKLWDRFVPHLVPGYRKEKMEGRIISIPDGAANLKLGRSVIKAIPAHFLHSVDNSLIGSCN